MVRVATTTWWCDRLFITAATSNLYSVVFSLVQFACWILRLSNILPRVYGWLCVAREDLDRSIRESWRGLDARHVKFSWNFSEILGKFPFVRRQLFVFQTKLAGRDSSPVERTTTSFHSATNSPWLLFKIEFRVCDSRKSPSDYFREYAELRLAAVRWPVSTKFRLSKCRFSRSVV